MGNYAALGGYPLPKEFDAIRRTIRTWKDFEREQTAEPSEVPEAERNLTPGEFGARLATYREERRRLRDEFHGKNRPIMWEGPCSFSGGCPELARLPFTPGEGFRAFCHIHHVPKRRGDFDKRETNPETVP